MTTTSSAPSSTPIQPAVHQPKAQPIVTSKHVSKQFADEHGDQITVLRDMNFTLHEGEIVGILGRSGAGKSTFLRILAGLIPPSEGSVTYRGTELTGPNPGVALVFQNFALMPWLTVQGNVELGLEARGVPRAKRSELALQAIDSIGLDGFESAYPRELSGGMRQRVGFARALVLHPDALFMDEPFSALDVLTAENLRREVLRIWDDANSNINAVLIITHNIEEAVQMADRVIVLGSHPGRIIAEVPITLPRPRQKTSEQFQDMVDSLYSILTGSGDAETISRQLQHAQAVGKAAVSGQAGQQPTVGAEPVGGGEEVEPVKEQDKEVEVVEGAQNAEHGQKGSELFASDMPLPSATPQGMAGLAEVLARYPDGIDLGDLAKLLSFEVDDLFPIVDAGSLLGIFHAADGRVELTDAGRKWLKADILDRKVQFAQMASNHVPLVQSIETALRNSPNGKLRGRLILDLLRRRHGARQAQDQFNTAIAWGRYGELYDYDVDDDLITLDEANK